LSDHEDEILATIEGSGVVVTLHLHKVTIHQRGAIAFLTNGPTSDKEIWLDGVTALQMKKPNLLSNGYLRFIYAGMQGDRPAGRDDNTVWFRRSKWEAFVGFKEQVERAMRARRA